MIQGGGFAIVVPELWLRSSMVEQLTLNQLVAGSSPAGVTYDISKGALKAAPFLLPVFQMIPVSVMQFHQVTVVIKKPDSELFDYFDYNEGEEWKVERI